MEKILGVKPGDFGFEPSDPFSPNSAELTNVISTGKLAVNNANPMDDSDIFRKTLQSGNVYIPKASGPTTQYYDADAMKRYRQSAEYAPFMDPLADNEKIMAENWSKLDAIKTGLSGFLDNGIAAYGEYNRGFPRLLRAMYHFDTSYLGKTEADFAAIAEEQKQVGVDNPIFFPEGVGQHDLFTRQWFASAMQNAGFTIGTMAGFAQDVILFKKFGSLSKLFEGSAAARSSIIGAELGETSSVVSTAAKEKAMQEAARDMITNNTGALGKKNLFDKFLNFSKHIPIVGSVTEATALAREANAARQTMGVAAFTDAEIRRIGAGGLARAYQEWNFAVSESATEAGGTYADIYEDAIKSYKDKNDNNDPDEALKKVFRQNALEGATKDYGRNAVVLAIMNKIAFGNLFRKFGADSKLLNLMRNDASKFYGLTKGVGKDAFYKVYERKFFGALSDMRDINKLFGRTALVKQVGKDFARGLGKIELLEGLQENIQDGINFSLRKHYQDIYNDRISTWSDDFKAAVEDQMSPKGLDTFLQGALTGLFVSPISGTMSRVSERLEESKSHREQLKKTLETLNYYGSRPDQLLKEPIKNIKLQASFNNAMVDAASNGLKYEYFNNQSSAIITQALYAKRTGTFKAFKTFLNAYGTEYDAKEFEEATGINVEEFGASSPADFMQSLTKKLDRYGELYDKYNNQFGQYFTIENVGNDPHSKHRYSVSVAALQDAIHNIAFNEAKAEDGLTRAGEIARNIAQNNKSIGHSATSTFNAVTDYQFGEVQISILNNEIKTLEETEGPKTKETLRLIKLKKQELELLTQWNETAYQKQEKTLENEEVEETVLPLDFTTLDSEQQDKLSDILSKYYTVKNKQNNIKDVVSKVEITNVLQDINDYQRLSRDYKEYMSSVNLLSDPKNALKLMHSFEDARIGAFARLMHDKYTELSKVSGIFEKYVNDNPKDMDELLKIARSPFTSIDVTKKMTDHLENINKMINEYNVEQESEYEAKKLKAIEDNINAAKERYNKLKAAPKNIRLMNTDEVNDVLIDNYDINFDEESGALLSIHRVYVDADNNKNITHEIKPATVEEFFKDKEGFSIDNISDDDIIKFIENFEQSLYDAENVGAPIEESTQEHQVISIELKKLKNLVGKQVIYQGKKGTLQRNEKGFYIDFGNQNASDTQLSIQEIEERKKLSGWDASYELAKIAKAEGIDLSKLSREEYADYAIKNGLKIDDDQLRANPKHRSATTALEVVDMMKADRASLTEESKKAFDSFFRAMMAIVDKPQAERYLAQNVRLYSGTKNSNSWLYFAINNGLGNVDNKVIHKSYFSLKNLNDFSPEMFRDFMIELQKRGYNGDVKIFQDLQVQGPGLSDQVVMHGSTQADAALALQVAKEFYGDKILNFSTGKDEVVNGKMMSYSQILSDKITQEVNSKSTVQSKNLDIVELGEDNSTGSTEFIWETDPATGKSTMVDTSPNDFTLDDFPGMELIADGLTEEEQKLNGVNPNSQTIGNHTVENISENTFKIDGRQYTINEDEDGNLIGITYEDEDGNKISILAEEAERNPDSLTSELINVAKILRINNNVGVTEETLTEAEKVINSLTPKSTIRVTTKKSKSQTTNDLLNSIIESIPDEIADIFNKHIISYFSLNKKESQLTDDEVKQLSAWVKTTYDSLQKLEQTDDVISAINYISKNIINPINRKYGEQIITKPKRKATKSSKEKVEDTDGSGKVTTKGSKQGAKGISKNQGSSIIAAADNAKDQIEKHRKEVAVKMEELLPASNLFTAPGIEEVITMSQITAKDLKPSKKQKPNINPYDDDSYYKDFICNV